MLVFLLISLQAVQISSVKARKNIIRGCLENGRFFVRAVRRRLRGVATPCGKRVRGRVGCWLGGAG